MATEVGDLNIIQDEDLLRRMWQQSEDFSRKKEIRQRMYKLREERLKSYYITREMTTSGGDSTTSTVIHHKPAISSHAESFANQGFLAMKTKEIRDSASSPTIGFQEQSSTSEKYHTSDQGNSFEKNSSQQRSSYTSKKTSSSSCNNDDGDVRPAQTYAITYERDTPTKKQNKSYSTSSSSTTQQRYSGGSTRRENTANTTYSNLDATNDQTNSNGHFHTESTEYSSTNGELIHPIAHQNSNMCDISTRKILRDNSNQPSRSVSRENSNLYKTSTKHVSVDEQQFRSGKSTTKTLNNQTTKNTATGTVDNNSHYKDELQSRSRVSVETSATHNAFASSLRASPDRGSPSPTTTTTTRQRSSSRSSVERSTPEVSPRVSPEKSLPNDLSKKYTASFQHRISTSSAHLKSNMQPSNVVSSTSEYESDDSNIVHQKYGVSTTTKNHNIDSKMTNMSHTMVKSPDSSPERKSAFRPIVSVETAPHHGRKQTDLTAQTVTVKGRPAQPIPKVVPASQPATNTLLVGTKPDSTSPSKKYPAESPKVDKTKPNERGTISGTNSVAVADTKPKISTNVPAAGKRRSATCNSFTTPSPKGKPKKINYSSGSSESSSTESDSDSSEDERQEVTIEEIVDEKDATDKVKITNGELNVHDSKLQCKAQTSKSNVRQSTEELIRREKGLETTPVQEQPEKTAINVKEQTRSFIQQEKTVKTVQPSDAKVEQQTKKIDQKETVAVTVPKGKQLQTQTQCEVKTSTKVEQIEIPKLEEKQVKIVPARPQSGNKISSNLKEQAEKRTRQKKIEETTINLQSNSKTSANEVKILSENKNTVDIETNASKIDRTTKKSSKPTTKDLQSGKTATITSSKQSGPSQTNPEDKNTSKPERKVSRDKIKPDAFKKPAKRASESSLKETEREATKVRLDSTHKAKSEALIKSVDKSTVSSANIRKPNVVKSSQTTPTKQKTVVTESTATTVHTSKTIDEQPPTLQADEFKADMPQTNTNETSSTTVKVELTSSTSEDTASPMISSVHSDQFCKISDNEIIPRLADQVLTPEDAELAKRQTFAPQRLEITDLDDEAEGVCSVSVTERKHQFLENAKADAQTSGKKTTVVDGTLIEQREQAVSKTKEMFENIAKNQKPHSPEFRRRLLHEPIEEEVADANSDTTQSKMECEIDSSSTSVTQYPQSPTTGSNVSQIKSTFEVETTETGRQIRVPLMRQTSLKRGTNLIDQLDSTTCVTSTNAIEALKSDETVPVLTQAKPSQHSKDTSPPTANKPERKSSPVKDSKQKPNSSARSPSPPKKVTARTETKTTPSTGKQPRPKAVEITQVEVKPKKLVYEHTTIAKLDSYPVKETITVSNAKKSPQKSSVDTKTIAILKIRKSESPEKVSSTDSRDRKSTSPEKRRPIYDSGSRKLPEKTTISRDRKSTSPEKRSSKSLEKTTISRDRKSTSPEKQQPIKDSSSRKSPEKTTISKHRKSTSPEKPRPIKDSNSRKSPEKTIVSRDRKSTSPEKRRPIENSNSRKSPEKTTISRDRKSTSPEKRRPIENSNSRKSPEKTTISKDRKSTSPEKRPIRDLTQTSHKITTVTKDRKSTSPEKRRPTEDASRTSIKITTAPGDGRSKSPEKRTTKDRKSVSPVKQTSEKNISKLRTKFEETAIKRQFKKSPSPIKESQTTSSKNRPSPERKTAPKSLDGVTTRINNQNESTRIITKSETVPRKSPERVSIKSSVSGFSTETSRSIKRASPEKTVPAITPKRSSPDKSTNTRSSPEKTIATITKKSSPFGITLRNVKSTLTTKSTSVSTTKYETETNEWEKIEEIFDEELLEKMLEKAVKYDIRSRIRAQIRLIKRQRDQLKRTSRTPSPEKSPSRETKKSTVVTITDTNRIDSTDQRDKVKKRLFTDENTGSFSSSVTAATQSSSSRKVLKNEDTVRNSQKTNDSQNQSRTTYQNDYGSTNVTDSIVSSYGVGPTDQDGKLLFGLKALRTSSDSKSSLTDSNKNTSNFSSESSSRVFSVRTSTQTDSSGNVTIQRQEVKGEMHSENGKEPIGTVTNTQYSYHKPSRGEATVKTKTTTDVLDTKNEAAFKSKLGTTSLIRKISNEHFESAQRKFNGEKATEAKKFAKIDEHGSGSERFSTTSSYSYHSSGSKHEADNESKIADENDTSTDSKNTLQQATVSSSMKKVAKSTDGQTVKNASKNLNSATNEFDESIQSTGNSTFVTSQRFESRSSSSSFVKTYDQNGVSNDLFDKVIENNDARSENKTNETSCKVAENSISLRDLDKIPKTANSSYTVTIKSSSGVTPLKRQSSNIKRNKEINIEQIWDEDQLRNLLETCSDSELRSRIAAKLRAIMAENKNKETSATASATSCKTDNFSSTTKVHTSGTTSSSGRIVKANSVTSPFAKFHQLERHNSLPSSAAPIFKCTDPKLTSSVTSIKDRLLNWVKAQTKEYKNIQIDNFSTSWNNGLAFCALIHHFCPHAFDYNQLTAEQRRYNFELAFRVAEEEAGIAPLLDVEDMVIMLRPDWKCVFTYVQSFYQRFRATPEAVPLEY